MSYKERRIVTNKVDDSEWIMYEVQVLYKVDEKILRYNKEINNLQELVKRL